MRPFTDPQSSLGDLEARAVAKLVAASADVALVLDDQGVIRDVACGTQDMTEQGCDQWVGKPWSETVTIESRPKVEALLRDAGTTPVSRWRHVNHPSRQGPDLPLMYAAVHVERTGRSIAVGRSVAFGRDLRAMAALQQRLVDAQQAMDRDYRRLRDVQARYRQLFQVTREAVLVLDAPTLKVLEANPAAIELMAGEDRRLIGSVFPFGFEGRGNEAVQDMLLQTRSVGRSDELRVTWQAAPSVLSALASPEVLVAATALRQDDQTLLIVRLAFARADTVLPGSPSQHGMWLSAVHHAPDGMVVTDPDGRVLAANAAFLELVQVDGEMKVRGQSLDHWLGRSGVDLTVLMSNLRQRGAVRLFATTLRGELGSLIDVEISATVSVQGDATHCTFNVRDVGRRLGGEARSGRALPRTASELSELVGRVPLKDIVGEATDLIEKMCIQASLELTRDNRAAAAEMLGLSRQSLYVKLRRFGLGDLGVETQN